MNPSTKKVAAAFIAVIMTVLSSVPVFAASAVYTVKYGDSLWAISQTYQVGLSEIIEANPQFDDPAAIHPGDKITIPLIDPAILNMEAQIVALVNKERASYGLSPLEMNWELARVARYKSNDMRDENYFGHESPTFGSPFEMVESFGLAYRSAGENIAKGQKTAEAVMTAWMGSDGHRKNILSADYTEIGVGFAQGDATYWTQLFRKPAE